MNDLLRVVLATGNRGKIGEIRAILAGLPVELLTLSDFSGLEPAVEDGLSFEENARKKATRVWQVTRLTSVADDSGLEVDALGGRPGILSARFAGEGASHAANNQKLLLLLRGVPPERRGARFVCVAALVTPEGRLTLHRGTLEGVMAEAPRGEGGFGYDPLFYVPSHGKTVAELSEEVKNTISHRAKAFAGVRLLLRDLARP